MRAGALVLPLLLLAGCVNGPVDTAALEPPLDEALPPSLARVVSVLSEGGGHGEPSFGAAPDGTLFANGPGGRGGAVFRSTDNGTSWEQVATPVEPMPNFDPDLAVDKDGTVWFSSLWIGCTSVAVSRDLGETWSFNPVACNAPVSDRQYVIPTQGGEAYLYSHQLPTFYQMAAKTTDYGQTWVPTGPVELPDHFLLVNGGSGWGGGGFWNEATGSVFLTFTWSDGAAGAWAPGYAVTRDGGLTWDIGTAKAMGGRQLGLGLVVGAADEAGNAYLAWGEDHDGDTRIYMAVSSDDGATFGEPIQLDALPGSAVFPAITAGPAGQVAVAFYETPAVGFPDDVGEDALWNVTLVWTKDALAASPVLERGNLTASPVKKGSICTSGAGCSGDREFLDYFQIHRLPDGRVGALYNSMLAVEGKLVEVYAATDAAILT